jgi:hypothetical protein
MQVIFPKKRKNPRDFLQKKNLPRRGRRKKLTMRSHDNAVSDFTRRGKNRQEWPAMCCTK